MATLSGASANTLITLVLPQEYGYVLLVATSTFLLNSYHSMQVNHYRKVAAVAYPTSTLNLDDKSTDAHFAFNAVKSSHWNYTENLVVFLPSLLIAGLSFPKLASMVGAAWVVGRILFAWGYGRLGKQYSVDGKGRMPGIWWGMCHVATMALGVASAVKIAFF